MTVKILKDTFTAAGRNHLGYEVGRADIDFHGRTINAEAVRYDDGKISIGGFVGRYRTSPKAWAASINEASDDGRVFVFFGRDDRSGRFNKDRAISYEPETFKRVGNAAYWTAV